MPLEKHTQMFEALIRQRLAGDDAANRIAELEAELAVARKEVVRLNNECLNLIDQRDRYKAQIGDIGFALGLSEREREWSNRNDAGEACSERATAALVMASRLWRVVNRERGLLIDQHIAGQLTDADKRRLGEMQALADDYLNFFAESKEAPDAE